MRSRSAGRIAYAAASLFLTVALTTASVRGDQVRAPLSSFLDGGANSGGVAMDAWRFSEFTFASTGDVPVDPSAVDVSVEVNPGMHTSVAFSYAADLPNNSAAPTLAFAVGYRVDTAFPDALSAGLRMNGTVPSAGPGSGALSVSETISLPGGPITLDVFNDGPGRLSDVNSDIAPLPPASDAFRRDNRVSLVGGDVGAAVTMSFVNTLIEPLPDFPEPSSLVTIAALAPLLLTRVRGSRR